MIEKIVDLSLGTYLFILAFSLALFSLNLIPLPLLLVAISLVVLIFPAKMLLILSHPKFVRKIE